MLGVVVEVIKNTLMTFDSKQKIQMIVEELDIASHKARKLLVLVGLRDGKDY